MVRGRRGGGRPVRDAGLIGGDTQVGGVRPAACCRSAACAGCVSLAQCVVGTWLQGPRRAAWAGLEWAFSAAVDCNCVVYVMGVWARRG